MQVSDDVLLEAAGEVFLIAIQTAMPGINNKELQLCGQDQGAIDLWLFNDAHGLPHLDGGEFELSMEADNSRWITKAVVNAIAAIKDYVSVAKPDLKVGEPSSEVFSQLAACVRMLQYYSSPVKNETATALFSRMAISKPGKRPCQPN